MAMIREVAADDSLVDSHPSLETESFLSDYGIKDKPRNNSDHQVADANQPCDECQEKTQQDYKDVSFRTRLKEDLVFRRKFIHSLWIFWSFFGMGWYTGLLGPGLPDLRGIVDQKLDAASWLFTIFSIGYLLGSLVGGFLYDRFNKLLISFYAGFVMAVTTGILPWCERFPLMLAVRFVSGIGTGVVDLGGNAGMVWIWAGENGPYMQAMHFCYGVGGIISPLFLEPFLSKKMCVPISDNGTVSDYAVSGGSLINNSHVSIIVIESSRNLTNEHTECVEEYGPTSIQYCFLISGVLLLTCAAPFLIMYINFRRNYIPYEMSTRHDSLKRPQTLSLRLKSALLALLFGFALLVSAIKDTFAGFLMTFWLNHLKWSKDTGSYATALHWGTFAAARFSGIFLVRMFESIQLLFAFCVVMLCSFIGLTAASFTFTSALVWAFIATGSFAMAPLFPLVMSWTEERVLEVTGKVSSIIIMAVSFGFLINPLFAGYLMDNYAPIGFVYLLLGECVICLLLLSVTFIMVKKFVVVKNRLDMEISIGCQTEEKVEL